MIVKRKTLLGCVLFAVASAIACANLPDVPANACGNRIVEPGEDCDSAGVDAKTACQTSGPLACLFDCSNGKTCPSGYSCGTDGACRQPAGRFRTGPVVAASPYALETADVDGDHVDDVLAYLPNVTTVFYGSPQGVGGNSFAINATASVPPGVGQLTTEQPAAADLAFALGLVSTWQGRPDKTLSPTAYPQIPLGNDNVVMIAGDFYQRRLSKRAQTIVESPGDEVVLAMDRLPGLGTPGLALVLSEEQLPVVFYQMPQDTSQLAGSVRVGNVIDGPLSPCDEIVLPFKGATSIDILSTCIAGTNLPAPAVKTIALDQTDPYVILQGAQLGYVNGDEHLDLVVGAVLKDGSEPAVLVGYGTGDGHFASRLDLLATPDDKVASAKDLFPVYPLAFGQLTSFGTLEAIPDLVTPGGILLRGLGLSAVGGGPVDGGGGGGGGLDDAGADVSIAAPTGVTWTEARVVDLNGDGRPDVVAASPQGLDVYLASARRGLFDLTAYALVGGAGNLVVGDFDGDLLPDVGCASAAQASSTGGDSFSILFGSGAGVLGPPQLMGRFQEIQQVVSATLAPTVFANADGIADVGIVSQAPDGTRSVSVLSGTSTRRLLSPFELSRPNLVDPSLGFIAGQGVSCVVGDFGATGHDGLAVVGEEDVLVAPPPARAFTRAVRLWSVPMTGEAQIDTTRVTASADPLETQKSDAKGNLPDADFVWPFAEGVAVDVDPLAAGAVPSDELVLLVPPVTHKNDTTTTTGNGKAIVARLDATGTFHVVSATDLGGGHDVEPVLFWRIKAFDVDGDGAKDVVFEYQDDKGVPHVRVVFNDRKGDLDVAHGVDLVVPSSGGPAGAPGLDGSLPSGPPGDGGASLPTFAVDFTAVALDADPGKSVVVATLHAMYAFKPAGRTFAAPVALTDYEGAALPGALALTSGDVNGDGVGDLVAEGLSGGVTPYYGVSREGR